MCPKCYASMELCDECLHRATVYPEPRYLRAKVRLTTMTAIGTLYITPPPAAAWADVAGPVVA